MRTSPRNARRTLLTVLAVVALVGVGAFLLLRGDDDVAPGTVPVETQQACARLVTLESAVGDPGLTGGAAPDGVRRSAASALAKLGPGGDDLAEEAPEAVRTDVRSLLTAVRAAGQGDVAGVSSPAFSEARARLGAFITNPANGCQLGAESGSG